MVRNEKESAAALLGYSCCARRGGVWAVGTLVMLAALLALFAPVPATAASCTPARKAAATKALSAFTRTMGAKRRAYFQTHRSTKARTAFVKRQKATLKRLQAAARCQVRQPQDTRSPHCFSPKGGTPLR